nr:MAG TPA: hypothetical protein [Caudoviricetes sp.]
MLWCKYSKSGNKNATLNKKTHFKSNILYYPFALGTIFSTFV